MKTDIAVITTEFLRDFVKEILDDIQLDMNWTIYTYKDFDDIKKVYMALPESVRGVITSGIFPASIIRNTFPDTNRVIKAFNNDDAGLYRLFLQLLEDNRQLDLKRVFADVTEIAGLDLGDYLFSDKLESCGKLQEVRLKDMSLEGLIAAEKKYMNIHLDLWKQGKIDISVTRFSSIASQLEAEGLKVYFAYPSVEYVKTICVQTIQTVRIEELKSNQPASIIVSGRNNTGITEADSMKELRRALLRLNTAYQMGAVLQPIPEGYELLTRRSMIEKITDRYTTCRIREFLEDNGIPSSSVGYGIGVDFYQARINAVDANREARQVLGGASALINSEDELICPLRKVKALIVPRNASDQVSRIAQVSGLSTLTVQKVISAMEVLPDRRITAQELAHLLSVTPRSANRFLSALYQGGYAQVVDQRKEHTKGRPERIYSLTLGTEP